MSDKKPRKKPLKRLKKVDKLCITIDLHPRMREMYDSIYQRDPKDWDEQWVISHLRASFGHGVIARSDEELVIELTGLGYIFARPA